MACPTPTHMASHPQYRHIPCSIAGGKNSMHIACLQPTNHPAKEPGQDCFVLVQVQCSQPTDHIWIGYICIYVYIYIYIILICIYIYMHICIAIRFLCFVIPDRLFWIHVSATISPSCCRWGDAIICHMHNCTTCKWGKPSRSMHGLAHAHRQVIFRA